MARHLAGEPGPGWFEWFTKELFSQINSSKPQSWLGDSAFSRSSILCPLLWLWHWQWEQRDGPRGSEMFVCLIVPLYICWNHSLGIYKPESLKRCLCVKCIFLLCRKGTHHNHHKVSVWFRIWWWVAVRRGMDSMRWRWWVKRDGEKIKSRGRN